MWSRDMYVEHVTGKRQYEYRTGLVPAREETAAAPADDRADEQTDGAAAIAPPPAARSPPPGLVYASSVSDIEREMGVLLATDPPRGAPTVTFSLVGRACVAFRAQMDTGRTPAPASPARSVKYS